MLSVLQVLLGLVWLAATPGQAHPPASAVSCAMVVDALNPLVNQGAYYFPPPDPDSEDALDVYGVYFFSASSY